VYVAVILGIITVMVVSLFLFQRKLIYFPRVYEESYEIRSNPEPVEITYTTSDGVQTVFYVAPQAEGGELPSPLWVMFNGNAALALDWLVLIDDYPNERAGFLLIDYPGYGKSEGKPSARGILESSEAALYALSNHLGAERESLERDISLVGYSIGTGAGLQFAVRHPVKRVILVAPFTRLVDMARLTVGFPICYLLRERYDNCARLGELSGREELPSVHIFHGDADELVPYRMGRELADMYPKLSVFHRVEGADHNNILELARGRIIYAMEGEKILLEKK
jgi:pimeloyl-ACP methyl ester carboxylesterase